VIARLYKAGEIAVVATQPAYGQPGALLLSVARGKGQGKLSEGNTYGPYLEGDVQARFDELVAQLRKEGFAPSGLGFQLAALGGTSAKARAKAAMRLGWLRSAEAVEPLLAAAAKGGSDICAITDALGLIGDARALPVARAQAARKLLSRRRSGVEALRNLGDATGLHEAMVRARERLDEKILGALTLGDANDTRPQAIAPLCKAILAQPTKDRGLTLDTLYEIAAPATIAATVTVLAQTPVGAPHVWRYTKSIFKRAMLRHDYRSFGWLAHAIERAARGNGGTTATVKSGFDGETRESPIFRKKTQDYVRRAGWRYLRTLARRRPEAYAGAAALALVPYETSDVGEPAKKHDEFANLYLLHRILWGGSKRFKVDGRTMRFRYVTSKAGIAPPANLREEAFPSLWDQSPRAYLTLLAEARLREAHTFALAAIARNSQILPLASDAELVGFLDAPHEKTVELGLTELDRRFDARHPNWPLMERLCADDKPITLGIGLRWLKLAAPVWTRELARTVAFLASANPRVRALAVEMTRAALPGLDGSFRAALAARILELVRVAEAAPGAHEGLAQVGREALVTELLPLTSVDELLQLIASGSLAAQGLAGALLAQHEGALAELGLPRVLPLGEHEVALVRAAAIALVKRALPSLRNDPSLLFLLVESEWPDVRAAAIAMLAHDLDLAGLGLDGLVGLCDSSRVDVQDLGRTLVLQHFATLDPNELLIRLAQHPHANMRRFALDLVEQHLKPGFVQLARLESFFRAALFQLWPERRVKERVLDFLSARGLADENQAEVAATILRDFVRSQTRADFESAATALVKIKLAFPAIEAGLMVAVS
jgi:hypothetical protein